MSTLQMVKLKDIKPNPYRNLRQNPLVPAKVDALVRSINNTNFWTNVNARINKAGDVELAYGHHRVEAAIQAGLKEVQLVIEDFTDTQMMLIMHDENSEDYAYNVLAVIEIVRAVVESYAKGTIGPEFTDQRKLEIPGKDTPKAHIRYAPSFAAGRTSASDSDAHPYTADSIAKFLGMRMNSGKANNSVTAALNALFLMEVTKDTKQPITERNFAGKSSTQFYETVKAAMAIYKDDLRQAENKLHKEEELGRRFADLRAKAEKEREAADARLKDEQDASDRVHSRKLAGEAKRKEEAACEQERQQLKRAERSKAEVDKSATDLSKAVLKADVPEQHKSEPSKAYRPSTTKSNSEAVGRLFNRVNKALNKFLSDDDPTTFQLREIIRSKSNAADYQKETLVKNLAKAAKRLIDEAAKLKKPR